MSNDEDRHAYHDHDFVHDHDDCDDLDHDHDFVHDDDGSDEGILFKPEFSKQNLLDFSKQSFLFDHLILLAPFYSQSNNKTGKQYD